VKKMGIAAPIDSDRVGKLSRPLTFSCEKATRVLGYEPVETLEEGIRRKLSGFIRRLKDRIGGEGRKGHIFEMKYLTLYIASLALGAAGAWLVVKWGSGFGLFRQGQ